MRPNWKSFDNLGKLDDAWADWARRCPMSAPEEFEGPVSATIAIIFDDTLSNFAKARAMEGIRSWANWQGRGHSELTDQIARMIGDHIRAKPGLDWLWDVWRGRLGHHDAPQD